MNKEKRYIYRKNSLLYAVFQFESIAYELEERSNIHCTCLSLSLYLTQTNRTRRDEIIVKEKGLSLTL